MNCYYETRLAKINPTYAKRTKISSIFTDSKKCDNKNLSIAVFLRKRLETKKDKCV